VKEDFVPNNIQERIWVGNEKNVLTNDEELEIKNYYAPYINELEDYLGRSLQDWL
jgi:hypothetical protein